MAYSEIPADFSFQFARNGTMLLSKKLMEVAQICYRLFHAKPEHDIYQKDGMGLYIQGRKFQKYNGNSKKTGIVDRDYEYEMMIVDQFTRFTKIKPTNVIAYYRDEHLIVLMDAVYGNYQFQLRTSSDEKWLATEILPKEIRGV